MRILLPTANKTWIAAVVSCWMLLLPPLSMVQALPLQYTINHHAEECLYEKVNKDESFTISAFILNGNRLQARVTVHGPVAPGHVTSGLEILDHTEAFDASAGRKQLEEDVIMFMFEPNFERHNIAREIEDDDEADDDEILPIKDEGSRDGETAEEKRARRARERRKAIEQRQKEEKMKHFQKQKIRSEGKPLQKTFVAKTEGWYQFCVEAHLATVTVELDFRKESDYGGLSRRGHVFTSEEKELDEDELLMESGSAAEEGIKDEDFQSTRDKLKTLRRLLADIQSKQTQERHRLMVHSATNEHSHSRMVLSSLLETVLFMLVTGFQVFTIRRWFKGAPALGR